MDTNLLADILEDTLGPTLIACVLGGILYGIFTLQTYFYYQTFSKDTWPLKLLVRFDLQCRSVPPLSFTFTSWTSVDEFCMVSGTLSSIRCTVSDSILYPLLSGHWKRCTWA